MYWNRYRFAPAVIFAPSPFSHTHTHPVVHTEADTFTDIYPLLDIDLNIGQLKSLFNLKSIDYR